MVFRQPLADDTQKLRFTEFIPVINNTEIMRRIFEVPEGSLTSYGARQSFGTAVVIMGLRPCPVFRGVFNDILHYQMSYRLFWTDVLFEGD